MKDYLIDNNLDLDSTIIFQGVRVNESDMRFNAGLHIVSNGLLYHFNYQKMKAQCCSPLMMLQNHVKKKLLLKSNPIIALQFYVMSV
ncbi:MAG: hypothetical protein FK733_15960 [Asgard group archaeon]|nr:hypothetical protein [Asgard group archaeon]